MQKLSSFDVQQIAKLNDQLRIIEEKIYNLAKVQNQIALKMLINKENAITDYELEAEIHFFTNDEEAIVSWEEYLKPHFLEDIHCCNLNDQQDHNVSSSIIAHNELNSQKHCWLMHRLYDDFQVDWNDILLIKNVWFDINVKYQYIIAIDL